MRSVHIIGVPLDLGGNRRGTDMGPSAFRIAGIAEQLTQLGISVGDKGDVAVADSRGERRRRSEQALCEGDRPGVPAPLSRPSLARCRGGAADRAGRRPQPRRRVGGRRGGPCASNGKPLGLIWVDAHGDMNSPASSDSGNVHGMPLAALLGAGARGALAFAGVVRRCWPKHTVLVGIRNLDEGEKRSCGREGARLHHEGHRPSRHHRGHGARIAIATHGTGGFHVWYDLDACDPRSRPASARRSTAASATAKRTW